MRDKLKKVNTLYAIAAWGLLAANGVALVWALLWPQGYLRHQLAISAALEVLVLGLPAAVFLSDQQNSAFYARLSAKSMGYSLWVVVPMALGGFFFFTGLNALVTTLVAQTGAQVDNASADLILQGDSVWTLLLCVALVPGLVEELLLRGVMLPAYAHKGRGAAICLTGFLFAFLHGQPIAFFVQFALGVLLGYLCWEARSVFPSMLYHTLHNALTISFLRLAGWMESEAFLGGEGTATAALLQDDLTRLVPVYGAMVLLGGAVVVACLVFYQKMCRSDRENQVRNGLFPDTEGQMPCGAVTGDTPRHAWLPLGIGLAGAVLINILGFAAQFLT